MSRQLCTGEHTQPCSHPRSLPELTAIAGLALLAVLTGGVYAQGAPPNCSGYSKCPEVSYSALLQTSGDARRVSAFVDNTEANALGRLHAGQFSANQAKALLGELVIYDKTLSVERNQACASCHLPYTGFTTGIAKVNREDVVMPGSIGERSGPRKPLSYAYAPFAPVLHYRASTHDFVGGNFWDMRATGLVTGNPAGDQALDPPVGTTEMGMPDSACAIWRIYRGTYRGLFEKVWGADAFAINWPANTDKLCDMPVATGALHPQILPLGAADRARATQDYHAMGLSAAAYEASPAVSPFSSKFDAWQDGKATLTPQEMRGYTLFIGAANCSQCHSASGKHPLFTDFTAVNFGIPRNADTPYFHENRRDTYGFVVNPAGPAFIDNGVGAFLASAANTNAEWKSLAPQFIGTFQVATARNSDRRPYEPFAKAYMHNGYLKSLKDVVHFYNTRDVLARCDGDYQVGEYGAGSTCWPAPEQPANENKSQLGNLGLSDNQENAIVAFLETLTDGYVVGATP